MRRALGYLFAGAAGGTVVVSVLLGLAAVRAARQRELLDYQRQLVAWGVRTRVEEGRFIRGETDTLEPEPMPQFRPRRRPRSPLTGETLEV